jgi:3-phenylpropionate/trans-cinnamate dioxygenase ferredoxin component
VIRFDHGGRTFAIYRSPDDAFFATDGLCTHEQVHLADGLGDGLHHRMPQA